MNKAPRGRSEAPNLKDALAEAERVLEELVSEDPKLAAAKKVARDAGNGSENVGESTARSYRQHLKR
jgi:hypothetical protein